MSKPWCGWPNGQGQVKTVSGSLLWIRKGFLASWTNTKRRHVPTARSEHSAAEILSSSIGWQIFASESCEWIHNNHTESILLTSFIRTNWENFCLLKWVSKRFQSLARRSRLFNVRKRAREMQRRKKSKHQTWRARSLAAVTLDASLAAILADTLAATRALGRSISSSQSTVHRLDHT